MSRLMSEPFGRRLANVNRRFFTQVTSLNTIVGPTKILDPASNRVYLAFHTGVGDFPYSVAPRGNTTIQPAIELNNTVRMMLEMEISKHYSLVTDGWDCVASGGGANITIVEVLYRG